jgi:exodeoxyribonuclease III
MRIVSLNLNGIRSAHAKGFHDWLAKRRADVVCLQETKAHHADLAGEVRAPGRWHTFYADAEKKGYSGVALFARRPPDRVVHGLGWDEFDREGRYVQADFGRLSVASVYLPSGSSSEERQQMKFKFMERFLPWLEARRREPREYILCGDWNIAHKQIDLKNWRSNQKSGPGWTTSSSGSAGSMPSGRSTRRPSSTPGGRTAGRPGPRTSAGGSITR